MRRTDLTCRSLSALEEKGASEVAEDMSAGLSDR